MGKVQTEKGEVDQELENGPIEKRECRDLLCCLLFIASVVVMIGIFIYGLQKGNPKRLAAPYDPDGKACGIDVGREQYPYIYFVTPYLGYTNRTTCLKTCPKVTDSKLDCVTNSLVTSCNKNPTIQDLATASSSLSTAVLQTSVIIYDSNGKFGKLCYPDTTALKSTNIVSQIDFNFAEKWISDVKETWQIILACAFIALLVSFVYLILMRYCSGLMVWMMIIIYFILIILLGYLVYKKGKDEKDKDLSNTTSNDALIYTGYAIWGVAALSLCVILCCYSRIKLAIAVIKTAAVFIKDVPTVLVIPIIIVLLLLSFWVIWIIGLIYIYSVGEIKKNPQGPFAGVTWDQNVRYMVWYWIFGGLWKNAFILALSQFVIASTAAIWYFTKHVGVHAPVTRSFYRAFRYHLGSIAFGSLLVAIVQFIRIVLKYIQKQMEAQGNRSKLMKFCFWCMDCYLQCFERFIKFINKNAYIQMAIQGRSFCVSAKNAFKVILCNAARFSVVGVLGSIFIFIGKIFVTAATAFIGYMIITNVSTYNDKIYSPWAPTLLMGLIGYGEAILFMNVWGMAIDTILQCFITDEELNKSKGRDPQYTPETLRDFMVTVDKKVQK